jgi:hypothetical protein
LKIEQYPYSFLKNKSIHKAMLRLDSSNKRLDLIHNKNYPLNNSLRNLNCSDPSCHQCLRPFVVVNADEEMTAGVAHRFKASAACMASWPYSKQS